MAIIKQNTIERRIWEDARANKLLQRRTKRLLKLKNIRSHNNGLLDIVTGVPGYMIPRKTDKVKKFIVPNKFSIEDNPRETLKFFSEIIEFINTDKINNIVYVDSSNVEFVTESTLMYLFAIISDVKCANYDISGNHPKNPSVRKAYKKCGFDKLMANDEFSYTVLDKGNTLLIRGKMVANVVAAKVCDFLKDRIGINTNKFYPALIEMMTNTNQHAYLEDDKLEKKWQIFAQKKNNEVNFVFLDTGRGIPSTVSKNFREQLTKLFVPKMINEDDILKSAFEGQFRTRTEQANRGRGLPQIYDLMHTDYIKCAMVYSGKATVSISHNSRDIYCSLNDSFYGTLYEFTIQGV